MVRQVKPFNPEVQKAIGDTKPITCRPADQLNHSLRNSRMIRIVQPSTSSRMRMCFHMHYSHRLRQSSSSIEKLNPDKVDPTKADTANRKHPSLIINIIDRHAQKRMWRSFCRQQACNQNVLAGILDYMANADRQQARGCGVCRLSGAREQ